MSEVFSKFAPFIQEFIYRSGWTELRPIQTAAADVIFNTDKNLLITTPTASGKTEAAFFPILSDLYSNPVDSFGCIYIAPLKSLINDQFARMDELLDESGIPVVHWHGDVASSHKTKALKDPRGILQITPESLESMLINRSNDVIRLFYGLRYIVIDEIHTLMGSDRGYQIICQICRLSRMIGQSPRRIGLSATVGDVQSACDWLEAGSERETVCPRMPNEKLKWRLGMEQFYIGTQGVANPAPEGMNVASGQAVSEISEVTGEIQNSSKTSENNSEVQNGSKAPTNTSASENEKQSRAPAPIYTDPGYSFVYDSVKGKKCLVFANSREETEYITATLRQIASKRKEPDIFSIHHGNLSASIREEAELDLKNEEIVNTTCATVTLELGIDMARLERVIQIESPNSVSALLQRIGRSGRRDTPPEMMLVFREEMPIPATPLPQLIPWQLLQAIAIIQLYAEERFIEPPKRKKLPFSLMFQQTLSVLAACGELTPAALAGRVMTLPPFAEVSREDYRALLVSMIQNDFIERTETGGLIIGLAGERLTSSFKFYAVFKDSEDFTVRCGSDEIGTITSPPPVGDRFALAGRTWEVEELDVKGKLVFVRLVEGKMEISWPGDYGEIHTRILKRMKKLLEEDVTYPYLKPGAAKRLAEARALARRVSMLDFPIIPLGGYSYALFPFVGTRSFRVVRKVLARFKERFKLSAIDYERCYYITFRMERGSPAELYGAIIAELSSNEFDLESLAASGENPIFDKYDEFIPAELLRKAYASDRLQNPITF
ncbi:MAG: DEAD/DEAH box helicase [Clostridia bacterium]|nr:DEAD/DEAH box helicase [Clostridia bacterium]